MIDRGSGRVAIAIVFGVGSIGRGCVDAVTGERDEALRVVDGGAASFGVDRPESGSSSVGSESRDRLREAKSASSGVLGPVTARNGELIPGVPAVPRELARLDEIGARLALRVRFIPVRDGRDWVVVAVVVEE